MIIIFDKQVYLTTALLATPKSKLDRIYRIHRITKHSLKIGEGGKDFTSQASHSAAPFENPFDRLTVLSNVEGLTVLSNVEGLKVLSTVEGLMALSEIEGLVI